MPNSSIAMKQVSSSNLSAVGYDVDNKLLHVQFKNGTIYEYRGVPEKIYTDLMSADSLGTFFNQNVRTTFPYSKI